MRTLRVTKRVGKVAHFDDGPRPDRTYEIGDAVEKRRKDGCVVDVGSVVEPTPEEASLPHEGGDQFISWVNAGRTWTRWQDFCPRY